LFYHLREHGRRSHFPSFPPGSERASEQLRPLEQPRTCWNNLGALGRSSPAAVSRRLCGRRLHLCTEVLRPFWSGKAPKYHSSQPLAQHAGPLVQSKWTPQQHPKKECSRNRQSTIRNVCSHSCNQRRVQPCWHANAGRRALISHASRHLRRPFERTVGINAARVLPESRMGFSPS
jgi:hypothetical protein